MATVVNAGANQIKLASGQTVTGQVGGWYDGQQYGGGTLTSPGQFNPGVSGKSGQAPVQNTQDAAYLASKGDTGANNAVVNNGGGGTPQPGGAGAGVPMPASQPAIDLQSVYNNALTSSGVSDLQKVADAAQAQVDQRRGQLVSATGDVNDNPFLAEADRVGRIAKLNNIAEQDITNLQNTSNEANSKVQNAKADAQVQLNIATQQYNINSQQYQQNVSMFNNLLTSGALDSASPSDIASIATSTGLSTSEIQSMISSAKSKENPPQVITVDDGVNQKLVSVDKNGNIINSTVLGASTKTAGGQAAPNPNSPGGGAYTPAQFSQAISVIKAADVMDQGGNSKVADKKLAPWEVQASIGQLASYLGGDVNKAADLVALAMNSEGYGTWTPQ